jgi:hypothetical protein
MRRLSRVGIPAPEEIMVSQSPAFKPVALAGTAAISLSLIGFAALPPTSGPSTQTPAIALTAGGAEIFLPDLTSTAVAAAAPADAFSGLLSSIDFSTSAAQDAFGLAQTAFTSGEYPLAFSEALNGFNNLTVGVGNDLLVNGYVALTGGSQFAEFALQNPGQPVDIATALIGAHEFLAQAQGLFTEALTDFGSGSTVSGLTDLAGINIDSTYATDALILGLFDTLTGAPETAAAVPAETISFTDLLSSVEASTSAGEHFLTLAETAFTNGDYSVGLDEALAGFNNLTVGAGNELLLNGYAFLTGDGGNAADILDTVPRPIDFATGLTEAQGFLAQAQPFFADLTTELAAGHGYAGLADLTGIAADFSNATDAIILGLFDSLPGVGVSL